MIGARPLFLLITIVLILSTAHVQGITVGPQTSIGPPQATVTIIDSKFLPKHINVTTGTTVIWSYASNWSSQHTVTSVGNTTQSGAPLLNSGTLNPGQSYQYTFYNPGLYTYQCAYHFTSIYMSNAWVNVTGSTITPPSTQNPQLNDSLIALGAGAITAVILATLALFVRRRKLGTSIPQTSNRDSKNA